METYFMIATVAIFIGLLFITAFLNVFMDEFHSGENDEEIGYIEGLIVYKA